MVQLVIRQPGVREASAALPPGVYLVGAGSDCHIQLRRPEVSQRHAQIIVRDGRVTVTDLGSSNGTFIGATQLFAHVPAQLPPREVVHIGKVELLFDLPPVQAEAAPAEPPPREKTAAAPVPAPAPASGGGESSGADEFGKARIPLLKISGVPENVRPFAQEIKKRAHKELLVRLNLKKMALSGITQKDLERKATETIREILSELSVELPPGLTLEVIEQELVQEAIGLGPLEYLISRDDITEIMVNGPDHVYVEKKGVLYRTDTAFADNNQVQSAIERIVSPLGRRIDESSPMVDARLADGSRVNAVIPPLSLVGPSITIRKFAKKPFQVRDLINFGTLSEPMSRFLAACVAIRKNIVISGGTGSGKTTLLNVLSSFIPNRERIITIEDAAELQLHQEHIVRLESRPANVEGRGEVTIRDLVRNSLRMRPDRIVVGECRGGEALDMLQAMNTGHDGSLTTIHANTPRDALARLETLVLMAGFDLPLRAIREQICSAIDVVVQVTRERDGTRKITYISEITKMEGDVITMQDIFDFKNLGWDDDNRIIGRFEPTGSIPTFMEDIERAKIPLPISIFDRHREEPGGAGGTGR